MYRFRKKGSIVDTAAYPEYVLESERLRSFHDWPTQLKQKPVQLTVAGFFYSGLADRVICFSCGGCLRQWEEHDDVWVEHAYFYNECKYLQLQKGYGFYQSTLERKLKTITEKYVDPGRNEDEASSDKPNEQSNVDDESKERTNECQICYTKEFNAVFIPCGHIISCIECASPLKDCPLCRIKIDDIVRVYFP